MNEEVFSRIKGNYFIFRGDNHVILIGRELWIFKLDGTFIACRKDIRSAYKVAFVKGERLLTGGGNGAYHMISLVDGSELWRIPQRKREISAERFAVNPEGSLAYDYYWWKNKLFIVEIDLSFGTAKEHLVSSSFRTAKDILCDDQGFPCLLQTHYSVFDGEQMSENSILQIHPNGIGVANESNLKNRWQFSSTRISERFLGDTGTVITNDLHLYYPISGNIFSLLENSKTRHTPSIFPSRYTLDYTGRYVVLMYDVANIVIDTFERKVVARYACNYTVGCVVGTQFWMSSENGIVVKPFPVLEEIPEKRHHFWRPEI